MSRVRLYKSTFSSGEVTPQLLGRTDLRAFENGALQLRNVFIHPTGGLSRRAGLRYVDSAWGPGRLVAFEFSTEQVYLLLFTDLLVDVYREGVKVASFPSPWRADHLRQISWTQSADTLLIVHPDVPPRRITRMGDQEWQIAEWAFYEENGRTYMPYFKFAGDEVTLTPSGVSGSITLEASSEVFDQGHAGLHIRLEGKELRVTTVVSPTTVHADVLEALPSQQPSRHWEEPAFSPVRGWPVSVCFHQDRLVIGGSRDLPNHIWFSKSGDLFNFDLGEGLDDEAIEFAILSDQVNAIRAVFSGRHLQVFTSGAEWMVTGDPLTPTSIQLNRQTRVGSPIDRNVAPRDVDGATIFAPRTGSQVHEFLFADVEQAYQAPDLAMLAHHLINRPLEMDFDKTNRLFHLVMSDGSLATVTVYRTEQVNAWSLQQTSGIFHSLAVVGEETYLLVERNGGYFIEIMDPHFFVDAGLSGTSDTPASHWTGLEHLEGQTVKIIADGSVRPDAVVENGSIMLDEPATTLQVGLPFVHIVEPLPPSAQPLGSGVGAKVRPVSITFRLLDTCALQVDAGRGLVDLSFRRFGRTKVFDSPLPSFTGDRTIRSLGWSRDGSKPLWRIEQEAPVPFTLLSVATEIAVGG